MGFWTDFQWPYTQSQTTLNLGPSSQGSLLHTDRPELGSRTLLGYFLEQSLHKLWALNWGKETCITLATYLTFYTISSEIGRTFRIILKLPDWLSVSHMIWYSGTFSFPHYWSVLRLLSHTILEKFYGVPSPSIIFPGKWCSGFSCEKLPKVISVRDIRGELLEDRPRSYSFFSLPEIT